MPRVRNARVVEVAPKQPRPAPAETTVGPLSSRGGACRIWVGDCRRILPGLPEVRAQAVDLVFADPPFNWNRAYDQWNDALPREDYLQFTRDWLTICAGALKPTGTMWVNIPDDTAADIVVFVRDQLRMPMANWCIWHYRFGQNRTGGFINSKVHALCFVKSPERRTWNPLPVLEPSDRATTYFDPRTQNKRDGMPPGMRVPMDVWYGQYWGRVQGNNKERRSYHDNQLPEAYLERVVLSTSNPGDLVLDPFTGSGTTAVMAVHYGRRFIGTEFSLANARSALARVEAGPHKPGKALGKPTAIFAPRTTGRAGKAQGR